MLSHISRMVFGKRLLVVLVVALLHILRVKERTFIEKVCKRQETNTPLQALVLLNDPQIVEAARILAKNAMDLNKETSDQIKYIFKQATSRAPEEEEFSMLSNYYDGILQIVDEEGIGTQEYLSIGDFEMNKNYSTNQLAALALMAHTILNLDEIITRG